MTDDLYLRIPPGMWRRNKQGIRELAPMVREWCVFNLMGRAWFRATPYIPGDPPTFSYPAVGFETDIDMVLFKLFWADRLQV